MSVPGLDALPFATEETYLHATDRVAEETVRTLLVIEVGDEAYAIPTDVVREIIRTVEVTEVPRTPRFVLGVISVRGAIIPVLDLRLRLGFAHASPDRRARIVIVTAGAQRYGLRVDAVVGLERFREAEIEAAPAIFGAGRTSSERYIGGIGRAIDHQARIVVFLDLPQLLAFADELQRHRQARRAVESPRA